MDNISLQKIKEILEKETSISIVVGKNPSVDDMAAALGFYLTLANSGKSVSIACPTDPIVELSSLVGINKVKKNLENKEGGDLVVSFPYKEGEIEKVSYTLDGGYLNIVVKAGEEGLSFSEKEILFKRSSSALSGTLFVIGTARLSDLGTLFNPQQLKDTKVINIDNKPDNQGFGDIALVNPRFSSVSEAVFNLITFCGYKIDLDAAQNFLSGISSATNNFSDPKTTALAFETAAMLLRSGAVRQKMSLPREENVLRHLRQINSNQDSLDKSETPLSKVEKKGEDEEAPADWLTPKVYKGSTIL